MAPIIPNFNALKSPFNGLSAGVSLTTQTSTPQMAGGLAIPTIPQVSTPSSQNSQNMPLLTPPASVTNPNATQTPTPTISAPKTTPVAPVISPYAPKPSTASMQTTPSGSVVNAATGGVMSVPTPTIPNVGGPTTPTATPTPAANPYTSPEYEAAMKAYLAATTVTPEEEQNAKDLANIESSLRSAYTNTEGQAIPLEFITGQKRRLQESAVDLAQPLQAKQTLLQNKKTAALDASKFALEQAGKMLDRKKPVELSAGGQLINPITGEVVASAPKAATTANANNDPARVLSIDEAKTLGVPYGTTVGDAVKSGKTPGKEDAGKDSTGTIMTALDQLIASDTNAISGVPSLSAFIPGTDAQKTKNLYDQVKGMLSLENRNLLKGSGAISDFESKTLEKAASSLGRNLSDKDFKATLQDLKVDLTIGKMMKDGIPNDVIEQVVGKKIPFSSVGNTSVSIPKTSRLSFVNNNPGNLRFAGQEGATEGEGGFAKFATADEGIKALENQIKLDASRGHTLESFVYKYAPPSENDTKKYLADLETATSSKAETPIAQIDINKLLKAIAKKESGTKIT